VTEPDSLQMAKRKFDLVTRDIKESQRLAKTRLRAILASTGTDRR